MPLYEYKCNHCKRIWEVFSKTIIKNRNKSCPWCGRIATRIPSASTFKLIGSGWPGKESKEEI